MFFLLCDSPKSWLCSQLQNLGHTWVSTQLFKSSGHPHGWKRPTCGNHSLHCGGFFLWIKAREDAAHYGSPSLAMDLPREMTLFTSKGTWPHEAVGSEPSAASSVAPALVTSDWPATQQLSCGPLCLFRMILFPSSRVVGEGESTPGKERSCLLPESLPVE